MSVQRSAFKSIFEGSNVRVRTIDLAPSVRKAFGAFFAYERAHSRVTDEEIEEIYNAIPKKQRESPNFIPIRLSDKPGKLYRNSRKDARDPWRCCKYEQELLGNQSVIDILEKARRNKNSITESCRRYASENFQWCTANFRYGFQVAYDIYTSGVISERSHALHDEMERELAKLASKL